MKSVFIGKRTIKSGECAVLWSLGGKSKEIQGPRRVRMWCTTIRFLDRFSADQTQYLRVKYRSGEVEHIPGPKTIFLNPVAYDSIEVCDAVVLASGSAVVVYRQHVQGVPASTSEQSKVPEAALLDTASSVEARIVHGPAIFVPEATEWLHEFPWLAPCPSNGRRMDDNSLAQSYAVAHPSHCLSLLKQQCETTVDEVQTADDGRMNLEFVFWFKIVDIDALLLGTDNPVRDLQMALRSDIIHTASTLLQENFKTSASTFGCLESYPTLLDCAVARGIEISKIVNNRITHAEASPKLAAERRDLDRMKEEENTRNALGITKLREDHHIEQLRKNFAMKAEADDAQRHLEDLRHKAELARADAKHTQDLRHKSEEMEAQLQQIRALVSLGVKLGEVDLNQLLSISNEYPNPNTNQGGSPSGVVPDSTGTGKSDVLESEPILVKMDVMRNANA